MHILTSCCKMILKGVGIILYNFFSLLWFLACVSAMILMSPILGLMYYFCVKKYFYSDKKLRQNRYEE